MTALDGTGTLAWVIGDTNEAVRFLEATLATAERLRADVSRNPWCA